MAIVAVDIDGVIASTLKNGKYPEDYPKKKPLPDSLRGLQELKKQGHYVYLFTARYEEDREITEEWLTKHGFSGLYEELVMGKPKYDIILDDRAIRHKDWDLSLIKIANMAKTGVYHNDTNSTEVRQETVGSGRLAR